jgi:H+/Cl- antiporter ClcA
MAETAASPGDPASTIRSKLFVVLLVLAALIGVVASLAAWCFVELIHQIQVGVYTDLPKDFGYDKAPEWWSLPILAIAGVVTAFAIVRLPGRGGHLPADGLGGGVTQPVDLPGVILAALATIGLGIVLGPEAPLIALGSGLGLLAIRLARRDAPPQVALVLATAGTFASMSLIFDSPIIAAVILIEAAGLGGPTLSLVLLPGLLAAGIGSLISIGMGSWTGLSTSAYALGPLSLPQFARPDIADFGWSILLAAAVAIVSFVVFRLARGTVRVVTTRPFVLVPVAGLAVSGLAIAFAETSGKSVNEVLFSGQDALPGLVSGAASWSLSALALLIVFKGLAWAISLGSFRGGPTFPALFLGAAGGLMAAQLPGYSITPAVAVGIGAAVASVLRLPLSAVVLAALLTANTGAGALPLVIVGVVVAYVTSSFLSGPPAANGAAGGAANAAAADQAAPAAPGAPSATAGG